jgi:hypothetical protein
MTDDLRGALIRLAVGYIAPGERDSIGLRQQAEQQAERLVDLMLPAIATLDADAHAIANARRQGRREVLDAVAALDPVEVALGGHAYVVAELHRRYA